MALICAVVVAFAPCYPQSPKADDAGYRELCVNYMLLLCELDTNEAREFHNRQRAFGITSDARMYEARARLEEREGDSAKALKILQEGLRIGAGPADILTSQIAGLHMRLSKPADAEIQDILEPLASQTNAHDVGMEVEAESVSTAVGIEQPHMALIGWADCSTQTASSSRAKMPRQDQSCEPSNRICLQRWLRIERRRCLLSCLAGWKHLIDMSAQMRREALFDALRSQLDMSQRRCDAIERCLARGQSDGRKSWLRLGLRSWRSLSKLCGQRKRLANAAFQEAVRRFASLALWAWYRICLATDRLEDTRSAAEPASSLDSLLVDLCPGCEEGSNAECSGHPVLDDLQERRAAGKPSGVAPGSRSPERQPLASVALQNARLVSEAEDSKRLRGPERFFYDTSSYTGCARYGGPMIVDKKENASGQVKPAANKVAGPAHCMNPQGQAPGKRNKPFLPR